MVPGLLFFLIMWNDIVLNSIMFVIFSNCISVSKVKNLGMFFPLIIFFFVSRLS